MGGDIRYWTDYFPIDRHCGMMNMPWFGEESPHEATRSFIELLLEGGQVVLASGNSITVSSDVPGEKYQSTYFDGEVDDMEPLRRVVLLHLTGADLATLRQFLLPEWRFVHNLLSLTEELTSA